MRCRNFYLFSIALVWSLSGAVMLYGQAPDLSLVKDRPERIKIWEAYCESLRLNSSGTKNNYAVLEDAALEGVSLTDTGDAVNRSRFLFFAGFASYYQVKFDSAKYYLDQSLSQAKKARSAELISSACVALIPLDFQLQHQDEVDNCKTTLQAILDTTKNQKILQDGYSAMGSYYQQKSYYSTAQDYLLKSIALRKKQVDTTQDKKLKADYAIQCYILSKQYGNTDTLFDKSLAILKEGQPYAAVSPPVYLRYLSSFTEVYALLGNIDSALHYQKMLEGLTRNSPVVPSEIVSANLNIAKYYLERQQVAAAFPYVTAADTLAKKSGSPILLYQAQLWMGRYLEQDGKFQLAISSLAQSLPVARKISKEQYAEGLKYMAIAQKGAGNANESVKYYEQYVQQADSLTKEKISRNFADQETRYETNQKEQRIVTLDKENQLNILELQNATRTKLLLIIGLGALGVISLLLYFIYRNKEKVNKLLNRQNDQLDALNKQLAVANDTKAKLFGIISHDLRSPVSQIVQLLQLQKEKSHLLDEQSSEKHEARLKLASENVLETMEDILLWSKSQMQHFTPQLAETNLAGIVEKELNLMQHQIEEKNLTVDNHISENFSQHTDENFIAVILRNLLQNAVKYCMPGSAISISNDRDHLYIRNAYSSANPEILNALLENKQVNSKSSGLGLQLAKDLAGSIGVKLFFTREEADFLTVTLSWEK